ncbi:MAG: glutathione synthase [Alphaproteobacteria bacterium]|nr:glutathione synthase [Alphaproteobacteria bacterium]
MRIGVQMDPIETMVVARDTSLAFMLEAQARGFEVWWHHANDLFYEHGRVRAFAHRVRVALDEAAHYETLESRVIDAESLRVLLIRQDPPFDMGYVSNTYLLELIDPARTLVLNNPRGVRNIPEKLSTLAFADLIPATFVGRNLDAIEAFANSFEAVVLKPAFLAGGEGVIKAVPSEPDFRWRVGKFIEEAGREPIIVQEFMSRVTEGDKRVFSLGGEAIGAVRRMPQTGEFRANLHVGGYAVATDLDVRDIEIVQRTAPLLARENILFAGLDVIDGRLTEINVTSPTLVQELKRFSGIDVPKLFWDKVAATIA